MNIDKNAHIAEGVRLVGDNISIGAKSSVWYNSVIRCNEEETITIGEGTNIQDLCMIHIGEGHSVKIGNNVTVGHMSLLHGCTIGDNTLIGMGSVIMSGAIIGSNCIIGAGSLVTSGKVIPDGTVALGHPAKVVSEISEEQRAGLIPSANQYIEEAQKVLKK